MLFTRKNLAILGGLIASVGIITIIHFSIIHAKVRGIIEKETAYWRAPKVWGQPQDGIETRLEFLALKEIEYSSGGGPPSYSAGQMYTNSERYRYPSRGTIPHLLVRGWVRNTSDKIVYLIGDKSRNGTSAPAYLRIQVQNGTDPAKLLNLHRDPFEREGVEPLEPGRKDSFLEFVPYDAFVALGPNVKLVGLISFVYTKPARDDAVVKPEGVSYSPPLTPPWDVLKLYFDLVK